MKKARQDKILELIARNEIDTQEDLIYRLGENGFVVTQATISRDIRELNIIKTVTSKGTYKYTVSKASDRGEGFAFGGSVTDAIIKSDYANNIVVLKTHPGLSSAVAVAIDRLHEHDILGCIAGDDTIFIVTSSDASAQFVCVNIKSILK